MLFCNYRPSQKSPISADRFDEPMTITTNYGVPADRRRGFQIQGKAKALYTFNAQNPRYVQTSPPIRSPIPI